MKHAAAGYVRAALRYPSTAVLGAAAPSRPSRARARPATPERAAPQPNKLDWTDGTDETDQTDGPDSLPTLGPKKLILAHKIKQLSHGSPQSAKKHQRRSPATGRAFGAFYP